MAKKKLNVAMIGYDFMGRAHSNAWRQVARFMQDVPFEPVMKVVAGRTEAKVKEAAERLGWEEYATRWEDVIARKDIDIIDICTPGDSHMPIAIAAAEAKKHMGETARVTDKICEVSPRHWGDAHWSR
jgi:predicted dehydrogenase